MNSRRLNWSNCIRSPASKPGPDCRISNWRGSVSRCQDVSSANGRQLGERCASPTQPRDHSQILAIPRVPEMMVGRAVEFGKHQRLPQRNLWCKRSRTLVREYRQRRNDPDRGWPNQTRPPPEPLRWLVQVSVRQKRVRSIGPNATDASTSGSIFRRTASWNRFLSRGCLQVFNKSPADMLASSMRMILFGDRSAPAFCKNKK